MSKIILTCFLVALFCFPAICSANNVRTGLEEYELYLSYKNDGRVSESFEKLGAAVKLGYPPALFDFFSINYRATRDKGSITFLSLSADKDYAPAQYLLGLAFKNGWDEFDIKSDFAKAKAWLEKASRQKHPEAQYELALLFYENPAEKQNLALAARWFEEAASLGHVDSQFYYSMMLDAGEGVKKDRETSLKLLNDAARQGHAEANFNLSVRYAKGDYVLQDYILAHMHANIAASKGIEEAPKWRDSLAEVMTVEQIFKSQELARQYIRN